MRNASKLLILAAGTAAFTGCSKQQQPTVNQDLAVDENLPDGRLPPNAVIETLPPDESSVTSNGELEAGNDNPDVNSTGNGN